MIFDLLNSINICVLSLIASKPWTPNSEDVGSNPTGRAKFIMRHSQVQGTHHSLYGYQFP